MGGVLQQYLVHAIFTRNLNFFFTGSEKETVLAQALESKSLVASMRLGLCTFVPALIFAVVHYPHSWLMAATGLLGLFWAPLYLHCRNLWPLGLYHGWIGTLFYFWFL